MKKTVILIGLLSAGVYGATVWGPFTIPELRRISQPLTVDWVHPDRTNTFVIYQTNGVAIIPTARWARTLLYDHVSDIPLPKYSNKLWMHSHTMRLSPGPHTISITTWPDDEEESPFSLVWNVFVNHPEKANAPYIVK